MLRERLIPLRFFELWDLVGRGVATPADRQELDVVKRRLADEVVARPLDELFTMVVREAAATGRAG